MINPSSPTTPFRGIEPLQYTSAKHHVADIGEVFTQSWIFVGLKFELKGLSHQGVRVGNTNLLLQCDSQGKPRAYLNVCSHRHAQLCELGNHTGAVRCPYHGWVYDREGVPVGIPQALPAFFAAAATR